MIMRFECVQHSFSKEMKPPSLPKSKCFPWVSLHCGCPVPRQALWGAQLVHGGCSSLSHADSLSRSIVCMSCCSELLTRSYILWSSHSGWCMELAEVGTYRGSDSLDELGSWHLVQLCRKDRLWAGEQRKCLPWTQLLPTMPVVRAGQVS